MSGGHPQGDYGAFEPTPPGPDGQGSIGTAGRAVEGARQEAEGAQAGAGSAGEEGAAGPPAAEGGGAARADEGLAGGDGGEGDGDAGESAPAVGLQQELQRLLEENERLSSQLLRLQADFDNYRRRTRSELERAVDEALGRLAGRLLPIVDNLERALAAAPEGGARDGEPWLPMVTGLRMVHQELLRLLADEGIQRIAAAGEVFDPALHQALERVSVAEPERDMRVLEELQPGYLFRGRVLRPSLVRVGVFTPAPSAGPERPAEAAEETGTREGESASQRGDGAAT